MTEMKHHKRDHTQTSLLTFLNRLYIFNVTLFYCSLKTIFNSIYLFDLNFIIWQEIPILKFFLVLDFR